MMSLETIQSMAMDAGRKAAQEGLTPYLVWPHDIVAWKEGRCLPIPFPMIGDYDPPGYDPVGEPLFVDTSGVGRDNEPALSYRQMLDTLEDGLAYAFTQVGQFQAYLQAFRKQDNVEYLDHHRNG